MASMTLTATISRLKTSRLVLVRSPYNSGAFFGVSPTLHFQAPNRHWSSAVGDKAGNAAREGSKVAKQGTDAAKSAGENMKDEAISTADYTMEKGKNVEGKMADASKDISGKAKQTAQEAWDSVKGTTQKIKDTVIEKMEETKQTVKEDAECAKQSMNKKN